MVADQVKEKIDAPEIEVGGEGAAAPAKKVELDLDDAPFLRAEEKTPAEVPEDVPANPDEDAEKARRRKKKMLILAGVGAVALVLAVIVVWWFFFKGPPVAPVEGPKPEVVVVPSTLPPAEPRDIVRDFAPFVVPRDDSGGPTRFLICKFAAITREPSVNQEMEQQILPLRDAIYYYLRSKDSNFLLDARNGAAIKRDLLSVFNDYLTQGKLEDIVFESYLSQ